MGFRQVRLIIGHEVHWLHCKKKFTTLNQQKYQCYHVLHEARVTRIQDTVDAWNVWAFPPSKLSRRDTQFRCGASDSFLCLHGRACSIHPRNHITLSASCTQSKPIESLSTFWLVLRAAVFWNERDCSQHGTLRFITKQIDSLVKKKKERYFFIMHRGSVCKTNKFSRVEGNKKTSAARMWNHYLSKKLKNFSV